MAIGIRWNWKSFIARNWLRETVRTEYGVHLAHAKYTTKHWLSYPYMCVCSLHFHKMAISFRFDCNSCFVCGQNIDDKKKKYGPEQNILNRTHFLSKKKTLCAKQLINFFLFSLNQLQCGKIRRLKYPELCVCVLTTATHETNINEMSDECLWCWYCVTQAQRNREINFTVRKVTNVLVFDDFDRFLSFSFQNKTSFFCVVVIGVCVSVLWKWSNWWRFFNSSFCCFYL